MYRGWLALSCGVALGSAVLCTTGIARADIKYTKETRMGDAAGQNGVNTPMNKSTTYVKQGFERTDTTTQYGTVPMTDVALTLCEKKQLVRLNPKLKVYTVAPLDWGQTATADDATKGTPDKDTRGTGKMVVTYALQDLGEETVAGFKTRHYMINMRMQSSGCAGDGDNSTKMEVWVADIKNANACTPQGLDPKAWAGAYRQDCKITYEQKGDVAAVTKAYSGLIMRLKMYNGDKVMMVQEITMLSQAKIDDAPFVIPADYKQVSEQEYHQMQTQAMMQAMTEQSNQPDNNGGDNNNGGDENNGATGDEPDDNAGDAGKDDAGNEDDQREEKPQEKPKSKSKPKLPKLKLPF